MSFIQICLVQTFGHQPSVGPCQVFIWSYSLPASGTSQHQFRFLAKKVGPQWTNMDQSGPTWTKEDQGGPRWSNLQRLLIVRSVHSVQSSPRPPPKKLPCSRWSALKIILVIVIIVFSIINAMTTSSDMIFRPLSICDHLLDCLVTFPQLSHVLRHVCTFIPEQHDGNEEYKIGQPCHAALELFQVLSQICLLQSVTNLGDVRWKIKIENWNQISKN